jgi:hypothetical protein
MPNISSLTRAGLIAVGLAAVSAATAGAASPAPGDHQRNCFFISQWRGWKAPEPDVLYLGVNLHDVYKVQLSDKSPELQWPDAHLITRVRGSDSVCGPLDLDLSISDGHGMKQGLIVTSIVKLTPEEIAAIPPKFKPN